MSNCGLGPRGTSMTTEVRTNIFTSSEPLHRALATLLHADNKAPPPPPPCKYTVWYHWHRLWIFSSLKICYVGAWKCQGRHAGSEIYWEFIDHQKLLSKEKKREGRSAQPAHQNATAVSHFTPEQELISGEICIYVYLHRSNQTSRRRHNSGIQSRIPTSVSAVTNTHSPRKWSWGAGGGWVLYLWNR